jgi:hypothetical protein
MWKTQSFTATDVWVFCGITWNNSAETGFVYLGVDGAALGEIALQSAGWVGPKRTAGIDKFHFAENVTQPTRLDDFRYYGRELSTAEVEALYAVGLAALA